MHTSITSGNTPNQSATRFLQTQNVSRTMSSREIAKLTEKSHDNVLRDARLLVTGGVLKTEETHYTHSQNGQSYPEFLLSERDCLVLVSGYDAHLRARIIDRWIELELRPAAVLPSYAETLRLYADQIERTQLVMLERDYAVATKAEIGSRREATAMATASAAVRETNRLKAELGRNAEFATITAVENATDEKLGKQAFRPLRTYCNEHGPAPMNVADARYGSVKAWPAIAWKQTYGIDLAEVFGGEA